jgi:hypothetical protein
MVGAARVGRNKTAGPQLLLYLILYLFSPTLSGTGASQRQSVTRFWTVMLAASWLTYRANRPGTLLLTVFEAFMKEGIGVV